MTMRWMILVLALLAAGGTVAQDDPSAEEATVANEPVASGPAEEPASDETSDTTSEQGEAGFPVVEETPAGEEPATEPPGTEPGDTAPVVEIVEPEPDLEPEPGEEATTPPRPRVDPGLRNFYLRDRNLGSPSGPRAVRKQEKPREPKLWKSEIEVGATGYRGNTESELLLLRLKTERKKDHNVLRFGARGAIGNKDGERDRENGEAEVALRREIHNRWYYTAEVRYFTDKIADVDYQVVSVLSPGYEFIRRDDAHLSLEIGPAYIAEKKGEEEKDFAALRFAVMMDKLIDQRILIWERFEYLPAIEDTSVFLVIAEVGVESILSDWFRLRTVIQQRYDSEPAEDKDKQDIFLSASLVTVF